MITPDGAAWAPRPRIDNAMVKALARAFRWRKMLDTGVHSTLEDLARAKGVDPSYASRILRLTLLAPDLVEAILDGRQPAELQLDDLLAGFPLEWERQMEDPDHRRASHHPPNPDAAAIRDSLWRSRVGRHRRESDEWAPLGGQSALEGPLTNSMPVASTPAAVGEGTSRRS